MSEKIINFTKSRRFRFDFGCDYGLYAMAFDSSMSGEEVKKMLAFLRNCKYKNMDDIIPAYLEKHHLEYSDFVSVEIPLLDGTAMDWAGYLLHSDNYEKLNQKVNGMDVFYSIMDYQRNTPEGGCEGCYFAIKATALEGGEFQYSIIVQDFSTEGSRPEGHGCFAIRKNDGSGRLQDIDREEGELVLPNLGCVDVIGLLANIEDIKTKKQAIKTAVK